MKTILTCLMFVAANGPVIAQDWVPYRSSDGVFSAEFPTVPERSEQQIDTDIGEVPYTTVMSELKGGQIAFGVAYNIYPESILQVDDPQAILNGGRDGAKSNLKGKIVSETHLTYEGHPGLEFTIISQNDGNQIFYHTRIFLIGTTLYQLQIIRQGDNPVDIADAVRFFASFKPKTQPE